MTRKKSTSDEVILDAARNMFLAEGVGVSTRKIAAKAGVSEGILFQRYGSKKVLFFKAMRLPPPEFSEAIAAANRSTHYHEALVILAGSALEYLRSAMPIILLVLSHPSSREVFQNHDKFAHEFLSEAFGINAAINEYFNEQLRSGHLRKRDYEVVTSILFSTLLARAIHEQIGLDANDSAQAWLENIVKVLID